MFFDQSFLYAFCISSTVAVSSIVISKLISCMCPNHDNVQPYPVAQPNPEIIIPNPVRKKIMAMISFIINKLIEILK